MTETAEELSQTPEMREELARATGQKQGPKVKTETKDKRRVLNFRILIA